MSRLAKTDTRYGEITYLTSDIIIGRSLREYGEWTESEIDLLKQLIRPGDRVVDVGGNLGTHSLAFAALVGAQGRVFTFEPQPEIFKLLATNMVNNGAENISLINAGVGNRSGVFAIPDINYDQEANWGALQLESQIDAKVPLAVPVPVWPLDMALKNRRANLIKIDVEGMELSVLEGASEVIKANRPVLYIENENAGEKSAALIQHLFDLNYSLYWHIVPLFREDNFKGNNVNCFGEIVCINMLCIPDEHKTNVEKLQRIQSVDEHPRNPK